MAFFAASARPRRRVDRKASIIYVSRICRREAGKLRRRPSHLLYSIHRSRRPCLICLRRQKYPPSHTHTRKFVHLLFAPHPRIAQWWLCARDLIFRRLWRGSSTPPLLSGLESARRRQDYTEGPSSSSSIGEIKKSLKCQKAKKGLLLYSTSSISETKKY